MAIYQLFVVTQPIIKKYIELGGKKVVLGSDAHNCSFLGNGYDCIRKNLPLELEIGYFKNREFVGINSNTFEQKIVCNFILDFGEL